MINQVQTSMFGKILRALVLVGVVSLVPMEAQANTVNEFSVPVTTFATETTDTIDVSGCGTVDAIDMDVHLEVPWRRDMSVGLRAPDGTLHFLQAGDINGQPPFEQDIIGNFNQTIPPQNYGTNPHRSAVPIANFVGTQGDGQWEIQVLDEWQIENGFSMSSRTLVSWGLNLECSPAQNDIEQSRTPNETFSTVATDSMNITGCGTVDAINLDVHIQHTWRGDLTVGLTAPDGTQRYLKTGGVFGGGTPGQNIIGNFNQTLSPVDQGDNPNRSASPVSDFIGVAGDGQWTLTVWDEPQIEPPGTLVSWGLNLECSAIDDEPDDDEQANNDPGGGGPAGPPAPSDSNWNFDPSCSAELVIPLEDPDQSNALIMLDQSGSMGWTHGVWGSGGQSNWEIAEQALDGAIQSWATSLRFGIGYFTSSWNGGQRVEVECEYDNYSSVINDLFSRGPGGGTPTGSAMDAMAGSGCLNESGRSAGGILVTDGVPTESDQHVINRTCHARSQGHTNYIVGLGGGTDNDFNSMQAAAAGTGVCFDGSNEVDPCEASSISSINQSACEGAYVATTPNEFQNVLEQISEEIECTFPVDTSLHSSGEAPSDPGALNVQYYGAQGWTPIPARSEGVDVNGDGEADGWYFPSGESNTQISLTSYFCQKMQLDETDYISTQLACDCTALEGDSCTQGCGIGEFVCSEGFAMCEPTMNVEGHSCHVVDDESITLSDIQDGAQLGTTLSEETNRCMIGQVASCDGDTIECVDIFEPMPETCDGLDNSCSGAVDDIATSWEEWYNLEGEFADSGWNEDLISQAEGQLGDRWGGPSCNETTILCVCDTPRPAHAGTQEANIVEEMEAYLEEWDGSYCSCSTAISP